MTPARRTPRSVIRLSAVPATTDHAAGPHLHGPPLSTTTCVMLPPDVFRDRTAERRHRPAAGPPGAAPDADRRLSDEPWYAHDHPERPPDQWCWLCTCPSCLVVLRASATVRPRLALVVRSAADRLVVTAELAAWACAGDATLDRLVHVDGDTIHEVYVAPGAPDVPPAYDGGSLVASDAGDPRASRLLADVVRPHSPEPAA
jgi:hypothetical protein